MSSKKITIERLDASHHSDYSIQHEDKRRLSSIKIRLPSNETTLSAITLDNHLVESYSEKNNHRRFKDLVQESTDAIKRGFERGLRKPSRTSSGDILATYFDDGEESESEELTGSDAKQIAKPNSRRRRFPRLINIEQVTKEFEKSGNTCSLSDDEEDLSEKEGVDKEENSSASFNPFFSRPIEFLSYQKNDCEQRSTSCPSLSLNDVFAPSLNELSSKRNSSFQFHQCAPTELRLNESSKRFDPEPLSSSSVHTVKREDRVSLADEDSNLHSRANNSIRVSPPSLPQRKVSFTSSKRTSSSSEQTTIHQQLQSLKAFSLEISDSDDE